MSIKMNISGKRRRLGPPSAEFAPQLDDDQEEPPPPAAGGLLMDNIALSRRLQEQGGLLAEAARWNAALVCFDEAVQRDPNSSAAHEQRAQILLQLDRTFDAVQAAQHACRAAPTWGEAELTLARAQLNLGEVFLALQSAERAITLGVENQDAVEEELAEMEHLIVRCSIIDSAATAQSSLGQGKSTSASTEPTGLALQTRMHVDASRWQAEQKQGS